MYVWGNRLARFIVDNFNVFRASGPIPHHHHGSFAAVFQLVEGSPGDQGCHMWLKNLLATIWEMHSAFSVNDIKGLVCIVTVHVVKVARVGIVVKPGMEAGCIKDNLSLLVIFGQLVHINEFDTHGLPPLLVKKLTKSLTRLFTTVPTPSQWTLTIGPAKLAV